jgi:uncharacterized protein YdaU (DUF1376 family)
MNYYERHLGDYAKDTAHLSMLEHGAYGLLLDRYYGTEAGIPAAQAHRVARARSKEEKQAVDDVLAEFFELVDGVWINHRTEREITKAQAKISAAKENGKKGGRPLKVKSGYETETQDKPSGLFVGYETETQEKAHQTPDTKHQTRSTSTVNNLTSVTPAGIVCGRLKSEARITDANPQHPKLLALLNAGLTDDEIVSAGHEANTKGKGFSYALAVAEGRRRDADKIKPLPVKSVGGLSRAGQATATAAARWLESEGAQA